jgi:hypothetical protein
MKYKLKKFPNLSGNKATIYSVIIDDNDKSLYELFLAENYSLYISEITFINKRLQTIGKMTGAREGFFKLNEGKYGDCVCALYDQPKSNLRLYCIKYGTQIVIVGGGGVKNVRALQDDPKLKQENYILRDLSKLIAEKLNDDISFSIDGLEFEGNLELTDENKL